MRMFVCVNISVSIHLMSSTEWRDVYFLKENMNMGFLAEAEVIDKDIDRAETETDM